MEIALAAEATAMGRPPAARITFPAWPMARTNGPRPRIQGNEPATPDFRRRSILLDGVQLLSFTETGFKQ
ncbi:hypothetical protein GCM10017624_19110 [Azotobacter vinelandii]|uniref:hypothetical protein n=1 Tax=Azotobacter vinelandii TaxID=354 RepID=UPI000930534B|nr:hypothetical protein [Azotobacter vinelandii]GLK59754.1 hypothetical protein GCM10017624_19110 [Azotobacter vinelandii]